MRADPAAGNRTVLPGRRGWAALCPLPSAPGTRLSPTVSRMLCEVAMLNGLINNSEARVPERWHQDKETFYLPLAVYEMLIDWAEP
ncbi:unnamed protein product [Coccothraustes coccothraustes]